MRDEIGGAQRALTFKKPAGAKRVYFDTSNLTAEVNTVKVTPVPTVDASFEAHCTPPDVALRMAQYLGSEEDSILLEPSCGTGNLVAACIAQGFDPKIITAVEITYQLTNYFNERFESKHLQCYQSSLEEYFEEFIILDPFKFDKIITNPPFRKIKRHMQMLEILLSADGVMVALVPQSFKYEGRGCYEELENLGPNTFPTCKVYAKIVRITKSPLYV